MTQQRSHIFTEKRKGLASAALARKIGYLKLQDFSRTASFDNLPSQAYGPHRIIRPKDELLLVRAGRVEIWHPHQDMLVTKLEPETLFGDMSLLGQTMLGCQAIAGPQGATIGVMNKRLTLKWIESDPLAILHEIGPRLSLVEIEHYRATFQTVDSRLAALLLELADTTSSIAGYTHEELGEQIGTYRETITNTLDALRLKGFINVSRMKITLLDKKALRELSEL
jgi:CRP-like cAMP-binding protein